MPANSTTIGEPAAEIIRLRRGLSLWIWTALVIADAVLLTRRMTDNFVVAPPATLALFSTTFVAGISWLAWLLSAQCQTSTYESPHQRILPLGISLGVTIGWIIAISAHASSATIGLLVAVIILYLISAILVGFGTDPVKEMISPLFKAAHSPKQRAADCSTPPESLTTPATLGPVAEQPLPECTSPATQLELTSILHQPFRLEAFDSHDEGSADKGQDLESDVDESQTLWLSRRTDGELELVEGWIRVRFTPGQREAVVHVAFCPPLGGLPEIETEDLDGVGLEIRVAAAFPFGARYSVRRTDLLNEENAYRVGFAAQALMVHRAA